MNLMRQLLVAAALIATGASAHAQATIDQNKALAGNVTPGDSAGFPITISQPGSYVLKGNLTVPFGFSGIVINADNVTLDLNGFTISGPGNCTRVEATKVVSCSNLSNNTYGVMTTGNAITIRRGSVQGFGVGIDLTLGQQSGMAGGGVLEDLLVTKNGYGVNAGSGYMSPVRLNGVSATLNAAFGISVGSGFIQNSQSNNNGDQGFHLAPRTLLMDSTAMGNRSIGVTGGKLRGVFLDSNTTNRDAFVKSMGGNMDDSTVF